MSLWIVKASLGLVGLLAWFTWKAPRLASVTLWSLITSMLLSAALLLTLPFEFRALALWMALAVPIIWVALQFWCYWAKRGGHVALGLVATSLVSAMVIFAAPPVL